MCGVLHDNATDIKERVFELTVTLSLVSARSVIPTAIHSIT